MVGHGEVNPCGPTMKEPTRLVISQLMVAKPTQKSTYKAKNVIRLEVAWFAQESERIQRIH